LPDYRAAFGLVDAVILALPNHLHAPIGCEFLAHGIHVLCEKPLGSSVTECEELCRVARASKSVLAVGYVTRFFPSTEMTKYLIESGFLGVINSFDYEFGTEGGWATVSGYNLRGETAGGGVLVVSGTHFLDRMIYLFGNAKVISFAHDNRGGIEANVAAEFQCCVNSTPIRGTVKLSKTHRLANRLSITGEKGLLEIGEGQARSVTYYPADSRLRHQIFSRSCAELSKEEDYFKVQIEDFLTAIRTRRNPRITGQEGSASVALIEECYKKATRLPEPWVDEPLPRLQEVGRLVAKGEPAGSRAL
jgi:predicted dehydrogenase